MKRSKKLSLFILVFFAAIFIVTGSRTTVYAADTEMNIYGIFLGNEVKGDSVLLESKGEYLLMDIGGEDCVPYVTKELNKLGVTHVSLYFSHLHMDHVGGSSAYNITGGMDMLQNEGIQIDRLYLPAPSLSARSLKNSTKYSILSNYAQGKFQIVYLYVGSTLTVGDAVGKVIGPLNENSLSLTDYTTYENNCSLATIFTCGKTKFFTAGDSQEEESEFLVKRYGSELDCDIMKLNHHGTGKGNITELLEAISPTYSFAENGISTGYSTKTGRWNTYTALTRASRYGVCYLVGNEKKTVIYNVKNDVITMYKGNTTANAKKLSGWVELVGGDGKYRSKAMYYIKNNQVLTGIQKIGSYYYNFGTGGCMVYGTYSSKTSYSPWNTDEGGVRCYVFTKDKKYARMQFGFTKLSGKLFYMDENGYRVTPEVTDQSDFTEINGRKYMMDKRGQILTNQFVTVDGKDYYLNSNGNIVTSRMAKVDDFYYIFDDDGSVIYTPDVNSFVEYDGKKYGVDGEGAVFMETKAEIEGDIYYFGKTGGRAKNKIVKIGKNYYYFGSDCTMVTDKKVKVSGKSYYFGNDGKMYRSRYVRLSNGKKYHCDKDGVMKLVVEEE